MRAFTCGYWLTAADIAQRWPNINPVQLEVRQRAQVVATATACFHIIYNPYIRNHA